MPARAVIDWLLRDGRALAGVPELQEALGAELRRHVSVDRLWFGTRVLHPQAAAYAWVWSVDGVSRCLELTHEEVQELSVDDMPLERLRDGAPSVRFRREGPSHELADIRELWEAGYHDYLGTPFVSRGRFTGGFAFATRDPRGFADAHQALLIAITPALSAVFEPLARDRMFATLLRTYLGEDAGQRVVDGQVRRGDGQDLRAAIWFSDVRGFTRMSESLPRAALLARLNEVFEDVVAAVQAHGGQVLKFMGDGVLAVFIEEGARTDRKACAAASMAADELQERLRARAEAGGEGTAVGVGLHYGELTYGNIGASARLDFTVIGAAVNLAARVEGLCGQVGEPVLASEAFAGRASGWSELGAFPVKGVSGPVSVYRRGTKPPG